MSSEAFVFLELPAELRLQIYSYILLPSSSSTKNQIRIDSQKGKILRGSHRACLALSQTCRQIHAECVDYLYSNTVFTITMTPSYAFGTKAAREATPILPEQYLRLDMIREARLLVSLDNLEGGNYIDIVALLARLLALRELGVAFAFPRRAYVREDNATLWGKSAALQGMVCHAVRATPEEVSLTWWSDGRETSVFEDWEDDFWRFVCVPRVVLEETARVFQPLRGSLCRSEE